MYIFTFYFICVQNSNNYYISKTLDEEILNYIIFTRRERIRSLYIFKLL